MRTRQVGRALGIVVIGLMGASCGGSITIEPSTTTAVAVTTTTPTTTTTEPSTTTTTTTIVFAPPLPNFLEGNRDEAQQWLEDHGLVYPGHRLRVNDDPDVPNYAVLEQEYPPGSVLPLDTPVSIVSKDSDWCTPNPEECNW